MKTVNFYIDGLNLLEIPISTYRFIGKRMPCGGGGYFRLFPYDFSKYMIKAVNRKYNKPVIFYFHPWELDTDQPVVNNINIKTRIRHYLHLTKVEPRLNMLLKDFRWDRMDEIFLYNNKIN